MAEATCGSETSNRGRDHEKQDVNVRNLIIFLISLSAFVGSGLLASKWVFDYYAGRDKAGPPISPFGNIRTVPSEPRLQTLPRRDLQKYLAEQEQALNSYVWEDRAAGIVRIPISRAMDLLVQRGLPVRSNGSAPQDAGLAPNRTGAASGARAQASRKPELP